MFSEINLSNKMKLDEIIKKIPEGKFVLVEKERDKDYFIYSHNEEPNFYESFAEAKAVAELLSMPRRTIGKFFRRRNGFKSSMRYWVYDNSGRILYPN